MGINFGLVRELDRKLESYQSVNRSKLKAYEGKRISQIAGVKVTQQLRRMAVRMGWPRTVVDVLEERLDFLGWAVGDGDAYGLAEVYKANGLDAESSLVHLDALIYGVGFALVGSDETGGVRITAQSPFTSVGLWDGQQRRLSAGLRRDGNSVVFYEPDCTCFLKSEGGKYTVVSVDEHGLGRLPLVMFPNRSRGSRSWGQSEITPMVLDISDEASRTLLDMAVHRTFHASPQRYVISNMDKTEFEASGAAWKALTEEVWGVQADPNEVRLGEFQGAAPSPFVDELRQLAELLAAESGIPASYLGLSYSNPSSADALRAGEARLIRRAERHQVAFGASWLEVARVAALIGGYEVDGGFTDVHCLWRDAATPTRAAAADEATKLVGAGILPAASSLTLSRLGFTPAEQEVLKREREASGVSGIDALAAAIDRQIAPVSGS